MDPDKRRAVSDFYREEFLRHLAHLEMNGVVHEGNRAVVDRACSRLLADLDRVCWREDFPALAEGLLRRFETLTHLSELHPRRCH